MIDNQQQNNNVASSYYSISFYSIVFIIMDPLNSSSIPVMRSPIDLMKEGPNSDNLAAGAIQAHPIDRMQRG